MMILRCVIHFVVSICFNQKKEQVNPSSTTQKTNTIDHFLFFFISMIYFPVSRVEKAGSPRKIRKVGLSTFFTFTVRAMRCCGVVTGMDRLAPLGTTRQKTLANTENG